MQETKKIEFKIDLNKVEWKKWLKTFCAFANSEGGEVWFGYNNEGKFIGIPNNKIDGYVRHINEIVKNHTRPILPIQFKYYHSEKEDLSGICVAIDKRSSCLNWLVENNVTPELYIRDEGESRIATVEEMQDLLSLTNKYIYDSIDVGLPIESPTFNDLDSVYSANNSGESLTNKTLRSFNLLTEENNLTLAGYLFCDNTTCPEACVVCNTWPQNTKGTKDYIDSKTYTGSIISLINNVVKYITNVQFYYFGGRKEGMYTYENGSFQISSLREAIVNAFAHRDYQIPNNEIQVNCFPDRIEISSPGKSLVGKIDFSVQPLQSFPSQRRNSIICNVLAKCRLMDEKGSGFEAIIEDYSSLPEEYQPLYIADRSFFTIILKNKKVQLSSISSTSLNSSKNNYLKDELIFKSREEIYASNDKIEIIENLIKENKYIKLDQIAETLNMTSYGVKFYISKMKNASLIRRAGSRANGYYESIIDLNRPAHFFTLPIDIQNKLITWCKEFFVSTKTFNEQHTSYDLKHIFEVEEKIYLTNGQFKGAMLLAGFSYKNIEDINWKFNISEKSPALNLIK